MKRLFLFRCAPGLLLAILPGAAAAQPTPATPPAKPTVAPAAPPAPLAPSAKPAPAAPGAKPTKPEPAPAPTPPPAPVATPAATPTKEVSAADLARAKKVFDAGGRFYDQGSYPAAIQAFEQAYAIAPRPNILFSMAQAHRKQFVTTNETAHRDRAADLYRQYLTLVPVGGRRADAVRGLEALGSAGATTSGGTSTSAPLPMTQKTILAIDSPTEGAMISIDGGTPAPPQVYSEVTAGRHTVTVTAPGYLERQVSLQAIANEVTPETIELEEKNGTLELDLPDGATVYVDGRAREQATPNALPSGRRFISVAMRGHESVGTFVTMERDKKSTTAFELDTTTQRKASIGLMVIGSAGVAAGGVLLGFTLDRQSRAKDLLSKQQTASIDAPEFSAYNELRSERTTFAIASVLSGGTGLATLLVGGALFVFDTPPPIAPPLVDAPAKPGPTDPAAPKESDVEMSVAPIVSPEVAGAWWTVKF